MNPQTLIEKLNWRYAVKQFDGSKKLSSEQVDFLKEVLRLAPSSFGLQPWKFVFVESTELRQKLREKAWNQGQTVDASHLLVCCRPKELSEKDVDRLIQATADQRSMPVESLDGYAKVIKGFMTKFTPDQVNAWMEKQVYIALGGLLSACAISGIDACPMEGFERDGVDEILGLAKDGLTSVVLCPIGYRDNSDKYATLKKVRYSADEIFDQR